MALVAEVIGRMAAYMSAGMKLNNAVRARRFMLSDTERAKLEELTGLTLELEREIAGPAADH